MHVVKANMQARGGRDEGIKMHGLKEVETEDPLWRRSCRQHSKEESI